MTLLADSPAGTAIPLAYEARRERGGAITVLAAALTAAVLYSGTMQTAINGSSDAYATDVGEIQNALPRWGTLHFTGYPLYSLTGSSLVQALSLLGVEPAAAASAVSLVWGVLAVAVVAAVGLVLGAPALASYLGALAFAVATSMWMDASVAEVHTFTMLFTAACLLLALRYRAYGGRRLLLALLVVSSQGVLHMRPVALLAPALFVLVWPRRRDILAQWRLILLVAVTAPLIYLYMPAREWMGADWTFGQTSTWHGFWTMVMDTKVDRIVQPLDGLPELVSRGRVTAGLLADDLPLALIAVGLLAVLAAPGAPGVPLGLTVAWLPYALLTLVIWEGRVSDALLAVKLPVAMLAGIGLAAGLGAIHRRSRLVSTIAAVGLAATVLLTAVANRPKVLRVTEDRSLEPMVADLERAVDRSGLATARPATDAAQTAGNLPGVSGGPDPLWVMAPWGHPFWALAYRHRFHGALARAEVVDHNADFATHLETGAGVVTPMDTFYVFPPSQWLEWAPDVKLEALAPGAALIRRPGSQEPSWPTLLVSPVRVNESVGIVAAEVARNPDNTVDVRLVWKAHQKPRQDYSVAVHLLGAESDAGDAVILAQADAANPVEGWWPTSAWTPGDTVLDAHRVQVPLGAEPSGLRVTLYHGVDGGFENGQWLTLPVPPAPGE